MPDDRSDKITNGIFRTTKFTNKRLKIINSSCNIRLKLVVSIDNIIM